MTFHRLKCYQIYTWIFTYLAYVILHCARKPLTVVRNVLYVEECQTCGYPPFNSSNAKTLLGGLDYAFLLPYAIGMILFGRLTRGYKITRVLAFITVLSGCLTIFFGLGYFLSIHEYPYYLAVQFFSGLVMSAGWPCVIQIITNWLGKTQRGFILGVWNSHSHIGNTMGTLIAGYYVESKWGLSFVVPGVITALFGLAIWRFMYESPQEAGLSGEGTESSVATKVSDDIVFGDIFEIPCFFCYSFCCFFVKMNSYILLYWLPNYLYASSMGDLTVNQAGNISTLYDFGSIFGCMISGWLLDRFGKGPFICFMQLLVCCPLVMMLNVVSVSQIFVTAGLLFGIGLLVNGSFGLLVTAIAADLGAYYKIRKKPGAISMVSSFIDGIGSLGAAFGPLLAGMLASHSWNYVFCLMISSLVLSLLALVKPSFYAFKRADIQAFL